MNTLILLGLTVGLISACGADAPVAPTLVEPEDAPNYDVRAKVSFKPTTDASDSPDEEMLKRLDLTEGSVNPYAELNQVRISAYEGPATSITRRLFVHLSPVPSKVGILGPATSYGFWGQSVTSSNIAFTIEKGERRITADVNACSFVICWVLTSGAVFVTSIDPFAIKFTDVTLNSAPASRPMPPLLASGEVTWKLIPE